MLVPTTLLAQQHFETFRDRFADWPVRIESVIRACAPTERRDRGQRAAAGKVDIVIGTHKLLSTSLALQGPRAGRSSTRNTASACARRSVSRRCGGGRRADPDGHADPAHAEHGALGHARPVDHRDPTGQAAVHQDVRAGATQSLRCARPSAASSCAAARSSILHNEVRTIERAADEIARARPGGPHRHRPRPDAQARARDRHVGLLPSPAQRAGLHHHHRERHRHPQREHHSDRTRGQVRTGAAPPAARPRGTQPPPGICLPADAAPEGDDARRGQAARRDPSRRRTGCWLHPSHPRHGNSRRRGTPGRGSIRANRVHRLLPVHGSA